MRSSLRNTRNRFGLVVAGSAFVVVLLLSTPLASAAAPIFSYNLPFHGAHVKIWNTTRACGPGGCDQISNAGSLNLSTGQFAMALNGSVNPIINLGGDFYATAHLQFTSPKFSLNASGIHVLTTMWWLNVSANATGHNFQAPSRPANDITAFYAIHFNVALADLTPFGASSAGNFWSRANITGNGSASLNLSSSKTMPVAVILTSGDFYKVIITLTATFDVRVTNQYAASTAYAGVNFASNGHPSVFQGFTIS